MFAGQRDDAVLHRPRHAFDSDQLQGQHHRQRRRDQDDVAGYSRALGRAARCPRRASPATASRCRKPARRNAAVGVWAIDRAAQARGHQHGRGARRSQPWVQVNRLGNPLVNELFIPLRARTSSTARSPPGRRRGLRQVRAGARAGKAINALFALGIKETDRTDIVQALFTGIPGVTQIGDNPAAADTLKLNLGVPPTAPTDEPLRRDRRRHGRLPERPAAGRRRASTSTLRVVGGFLVPEDQGGKKLPLGDGVDVNDKPFLAAFPYAGRTDDRFRLADLKTAGADARADAGSAAAGAVAVNGLSGPALRPGRRAQLHLTDDNHTRANFPPLAAAGVVFVVALAVLTLVNRPSDSLSGRRIERRARARARALHRGAHQRARGRHRSGGRPAADLRRAGVHASCSACARPATRACYSRAERAFAGRSSATPRPRRPLASRHARARPPRLPRRAAPRAARAGSGAGLVAPLAVLVDAQVELGRYDAAERTLQRWSTSSPTSPPTRASRTSASCTATSTERVEAMRLAASAAPARRENRAYIQTLLGNLELERGRLRRGAPRRTARRSARLPRLRARRCRPGPRAGRAAGGSEPRSTAFAASSQRLPLPEYVIALGEAELAAGLRADAQRDFDLVRAQQRLLGASGVNTDVEIARLRGQITAMRAGRCAWRRRGCGAAPSVRSADALGWALTRAGPARGGPGLRAPRAATGLARPAVSLPRGHGRARQPGEPGAARELSAGRRSPSTRASRPCTRPVRAPGAEGAAVRRALLLAAAGLRRARRSPRRVRPPIRSATSASTTSPGEGLRATGWTCCYILDQAEIPTFQERGQSRSRGARGQARRGGARTGAHGRRSPACRSSWPRRAS